MITAEVAAKLCAYCRANETEKCLDELYAEHARSVEAAPMSPGESTVTEGLAGIRGKHAWWDENFDVHDASVDGPYMHGDDRFAVIFEMEATHKASGERSAMKEVAIYTVSEGKIVAEEFYYSS